MSMPGKKSGLKKWNWNLKPIFKVLTPDQSRINWKKSDTWHDKPFCGSNIGEKKSFDLSTSFKKYCKHNKFKKQKNENKNFSC